MGGMGHQLFQLSAFVDYVSCLDEGESNTPALTTQHQMHIGVYETLLVKCQPVTYFVEYVWKSHFMNMEMLDTCQALLSSSRT